jgi:DNA polymerase III epsilon subunit-like protein
MPLALVFDVETTGLLPKDLTNFKPTDLPHIIQLSYTLYDTDKQFINKTYNAYINIPSDIVLKPLITQLTGITREQLDKEGIDISEAIDSFYDAYKAADIIVAHNLQFDTTMILIEGCSKNPAMHGMFDWAVLEKTGKELYCTMQSGIDLCKLERTNSRGVYLKQPKLSELYVHLFGKEPDNLHNSAIDVAVCLRCFLKMHYKINVTDDMFDKWCLLA